MRRCKSNESIRGKKTISLKQFAIYKFKRTKSYFFDGPKAISRFVQWLKNFT